MTHQSPEYPLPTEFGAASSVLVYGHVSCADVHGRHGEHKEAATDVPVMASLLQGTLKQYQQHINKRAC
jgi:hypothetical protein